MALVSRSAHRWWVSLATIAGALLAIANESVHANGTNGGLPVGCGIASGSVLSSNELAGLNKRRDAAIIRLIDSVRSGICSVPRIAACICTSQALSAFVPVDVQTDTTSLSSGPAKALGVVARSRVRVTRLQNGSILCCRAVPPARVVPVHPDANDDTASDGDNSSDDDDSQDDQNGDDDFQVAWFIPVGLSAAVAEYAPVTSWVTPSFAPLAIFTPLRC